MLKNVIKRIFPNMDKIKDEKTLKLFGPALFQSNLWHLNRKSVPRAIAIGLFCAFIPLPLQMVIAAFFAIIFAANLPISVMLVWITNPITIPPILFFAYKIGSYILGIDSSSFPSSFDENLINAAIASWKPTLIGSLILSITTSTLGYIFISLYWRLYIAKSWARRKSPK